MQSLEGIEVVDFQQGDTATELKENMHNTLSNLMMKLSYLQIY